MKHKLWIGLIGLATITVSSCDSIVSKSLSKIGKKATKETVEAVGETASKKAAKKVTKEISSEAVEASVKRSISKTLKEYATSNTAIGRLYNNFVKYISGDFADGITVTSTKKGILMTSKEFPNSTIRMNKNLMIGNGGSLKESGAMNEFLNYLLPNRTYLIDDCFTYKTDDLGRVISCSADRTKAFKTINRNTQRNSSTQKYIVEHLDGRVGLDDGGHLFANATGGPNELINQVPMSRKLNQTGEWRQLERIEEQALKEGKQVVSQRKLLYKGNDKRPYAIEFITIIDGKETKTIVENL